MHAGNQRTHGWDIRPVPLIIGSLGDPTLERLLLCRREFLMCARRRHHFFGIIAENARNEFTLVGFAGDDGLRAHGRCPLVEAEFGLAAILVRPVAGIAILREDRPDIPVELHPDTLGCLTTDTSGETHAGDQENRAVAGRDERSSSV
jgi:hypothetical protein